MLPLIGSWSTNPAGGVAGRGGGATTGITSPLPLRIAAISNNNSLKTTCVSEHKSTVPIRWRSYLRSCGREGCGKKTRKWCCADSADVAALYSVVLFSDENDLPSASIRAFESLIPVSRLPVAPLASVFVRNPCYHNRVGSRFDAMPWHHTPKTDKKTKRKRSGKRLNDATKRSPRAAESFEANHGSFLEKKARYISRPR